jgi:predicted TIM-barrel fold metal-dependent hydrolase
MKTIAIEEHFITPMCRENLRPPFGRAEDYATSKERLGHDVPEQLLDLGDKRLAAMDAAGIDIQVLSLTSPGCQAFDAELAIPMARDANDRLADAVKAHPDRFAGFAALPTADPQAAAKELERAITRLGFKGAMINGHTRGSFLDEKKNWVLLECAESLDVPIYMHPIRSHPGVEKIYYEGYQELARAGWAYAVDTSIHFLRLVYAGVFDAYPRLRFILGHLGEAIPFGMQRLDEHSYQAAARRGLKKSPSQYLRDNLLVTTSGNFFAPAFLCTMLALGVDKILFSVDWPFELNTRAVQFLKDLPVSEEDREKIAHRNAERVLRL